MYLDYYHLKKHPFKITCDPAFLWFSEKHKEALANLRYGLSGNRGIVLLSGEVGTGKTLLVNKLLTMLPKHTIAASLSGHNVETSDFYRLLAERLKLPYAFIDKSEFLLEFEKYVKTANQDSRRLVLIVDEAQVFGRQVLEDIRMLSNFELPDQKLVSIFLVGQPELNQALQEPDCRALMQRITARYHLMPLNEEETGHYIEHRLQVAGSTENMFSEEAMRKVFYHTGGTPRLINVLCDRAMLTGSVYNRNRLESDIITECAKELHMPDLNGSSGSTEKRINPARTKTAGRANIPGDKNTGILIFNYLLRNLKNYRFSRLIYAGVVPIVLFSLTLAFMQFDLSTPKPAETSDAPSASEPVESATLMEAEDQSPTTDEWLGKREIPIQLSQTNQIAGDSQTAIDSIAEHLRKFPEQSILVHCYTDKAESQDQRLSLWRQRVQTIRSHLAHRGVYSYQMKFAKMVPEKEDTSHHRRKEPSALIEYYQGSEPDRYNQDK